MGKKNNSEEENKRILAERIEEDKKDSSKEDDTYEVTLSEEIKEKIKEVTSSSTSHRIQVKFENGKLSMIEHESEDTIPGGVKFFIEKKTFLIDDESLKEIVDLKSDWKGMKQDLPSQGRLDPDPDFPRPDDKKFRD